MSFKNTPIQRKLMTILLLTSGVVLLLTCAAFFAYEFLTFRQSTVQQLSTLGEIIAANSTAALAFDNQDDAKEVLSALRAERHIVAACLYDKTGKLFAKYPAELEVGALPDASEKDGYRFEQSHLVGFQSVVHNGRRLGTLYLRSDMGAMYERLRLYGGIALLVIIISLLVAYLISRTLQRQISLPILALAETARSVSDRRDYSVRAKKYGQDEIGQLTDGFNQMLSSIQERENALRDENAERARLQSLFESLPGLYLVLTPDLKIVSASDAYLKATMTTREKIIGRGLFEVFPDNPDDPAATGASNLRASLNRVLQNAAPDTMAIQKYDVRRPDGVFEERFWSPVNSPVLGEGRRIDYIIHRVEDVTEFVRQKQQPADGESGLRARMEQMEAEIFRSSQEVQAANQQLRAVNQELEAFSYSVSHDLRAPLRHIDGYVEMLIKHAGNTLSDKSRRYLRIVSESAGQMGQLIDDLLAFSRMGRAEMQRMTVNLEFLTRDLITHLRSETTGRNIVWKTGHLPDVEGDPSMLKQVFVNLLSNAVKYTRGKDPAEIEIGLASETADEVVVFVRDNGAGFDMKYVDKLFGVFQRLHRAEDFEGTGVGLANVRRIINRHGGRTWGEGAINAGATFYFSLNKPRKG